MMAIQNKTVINWKKVWRAYKRSFANIWTLTSAPPDTLEDFKEFYPRQFRIWQAVADEVERQLKVRRP